MLRHDQICENARPGGTLEKAAEEIESELLTLDKRIRSTEIGVMQAAGDRSEWPMSVLHVYRFRILDSLRKLQKLRDQRMGKHRGKFSSRCFYSYIIAVLNEEVPMYRVIIHYRNCRRTQRGWSGLAEKVWWLRSPKFSGIPS